MTNLRLPEVSMYPDVMTQGMARRAARWLPAKTVLRLTQTRLGTARARPCQWSAEKNAGFTTGEPWFYVNENYRTVNAPPRRRTRTAC